MAKRSLARITIDNSHGYKLWHRHIDGINLTNYGGFAIHGGWITHGASSDFKPSNQSHDYAIESSQRKVVLTCVELRGAPNPVRFVFVYDARSTLLGKDEAEVKIEHDGVTIKLVTRCEVVGVSVDYSGGIDLSSVKITYSGRMPKNTLAHAGGLHGYIGTQVRDSFDVIVAHLVKNSINKPSIFDNGVFSQRCSNAAYCGAAIAVAYLINDYGKDAINHVYVGFGDKAPDSKSATISDAARNGVDPKHARASDVTLDCTLYSNMPKPGKIKAVHTNRGFVLPDGYKRMGMGNHSTINGLTLFVNVNNGVVCTVFELLDELLDEWDSMGDHEQRAWVEIFAEEAGKLGDFTNTAQIAYTALAGNLGNKHEKK